MKNIVPFIFFLALFSCSISKKEKTELPLYKVDVKKRVYNDDGTRTFTEWIPMDTRTMDHLQDFKPNKNPQLSKYGATKNTGLKRPDFTERKKSMAVGGL